MCTETSCEGIFRHLSFDGTISGIDKKGRVKGGERLRVGEGLRVRKGEELRVGIGEELKVGKG